MIYITIVRSQKVYMSRNAGLAQLELDYKTILLII